jgi:ketosteroid isomerase-like protein
MQRTLAFSPQLPFRPAPPEPNVEQALALRELIAHKHATFLKALARYDFDQALERWTDGAILFLPGEIPAFGPDAIRRLLADDVFRTGSPLQTRALRLAVGMAFERGVCGSGEVQTEYSAVWVQRRDGDWKIMREVWDYRARRDDAHPPS